MAPDLMPTGYRPVRRYGPEDFEHLLEDDMFEEVLSEEGIQMNDRLNSCNINSCIEIYIQWKGLWKGIN